MDILEKIRHLQQQLQDIDKQVRALQRLEQTSVDATYGLLAGTNSWTGANTFVRSGTLNVERSTAATSTLNSAAIFKATSSGIMADGFGTGFIFQAKDTDGVDNTFVILGGVRDGADNTGRFRVFVYQAGVAQQALDITADGLALFNGLTSANANALAIRPGTSSNDAAVGGVLYVDSTQRANSGTGATNLASYSLPANSLAVNNQSLEIHAWGTMANNANSKTLNFLFGSDSFSIPTTSGAAVKWSIAIRVLRTGAATQKVLLEHRSDSGSFSAGMTISTASATLSGAVTVKFTGQGGASNDILQEGMIINWLDANT